MFVRRFFLTENILFSNTVWFCYFSYFYVHLDVFVSTLLVVAIGSSAYAYVYKPGSGQVTTVTTVTSNHLSTIKTQIPMRYYML